MEDIFKKIFSGNIDYSIHEEFIKFGKGRFENRYLLEGKKQKDKWRIKTSYEFTNYFVRRCLENQDKININGIIVCTQDLRNDIKFNIEKIKQFAGVKQYVIDTRVESSEILDLMKKYSRAFYALSFSTPKNELRIKAKTPMSAKPSKKIEGRLKANFCLLKTDDKNIMEDLFFDFPDFKEIKIKHIIQIDSIEIPKDVGDAIKMREMAKKKGRIIRDIEIDGRVEKKEKEFEF